MQTLQTLPTSSSSRLRGFLIMCLSVLLHGEANYHTSTKGQNFRPRATKRHKLSTCPVSGSWCSHSRAGDAPSRGGLGYARGVWCLGIALFVYERKGQNSRVRQPATPLKGPTLRISPLYKPPAHCRRAPLGRQAHSSTADAREYLNMLPHMPLDGTSLHVVVVARGLRRSEWR